ncbi:mechanosensitive ion channel family protein [Labrenzia sp. CE80]|uniref:mechanosensitive ion channel family protein n=1 Tax=Labrenzia sp. CE80 TaxID=1788986 RepID=UPI001AD92682|nr:mechanosensitive ion channel family protein [Labrenzia sp. CE80]
MKFDLVRMFDGKFRREITHRTAFAFRNASSLFKAAVFGACLIATGFVQPVNAQQAAKAEAATELADPSLDFKRARAYLRNNPISPADTASPRATLESFLYILRESNTLWREVRNSFEQSSSPFLTAEQKDKLLLVNALLDKAAMIFDLSEIPEASRDRASIEITLQFQEILDRIPLPQYEDIPGQPAGTFATITGTSDLPETWTIPGSSLTLARQTSGERKGHYLISDDSVARIPQDYSIVRQLPLQSDRSEDLFEYYIYTPGNLIAPHWYKLIQAGPNWLHLHFADQAYWQWIALALLVGLYITIGGTYVSWRRWKAVPVSERARVTLAIRPPILIILAASLFRYLCEDQINVTGLPLQAISTLTTAIIWSASSWLAYQVLQLVYVWCFQSPRSQLQALDASLLRTGFRVFSLAVALLVLGYGATKIGIPVYGVIAGLGVGGLAIALAAQPTIENLIGGIILYADRMVRVGEFCQFDDLAGTVESIGIRSTRIRALDRTLITVANADLAKRKVINYSQRDQFHFRHKIGLRYDTSPEVLKTISTNIAAYLKAHEKVMEDPLRVRLIGFDDYCVTIDAYAYVIASSMNDFLEIQEQMLYDIRRIITVAGSDFAFPSSTLYLSRDGGLPASHANAPEALDKEDDWKAAS